MSPAEPLPPKVYLVPCDLTSNAHTELLYNQRVTCGWAKEGIERWKSLSAQGNLVMYWLVLNDNTPEKDDLIKTHCDRYPNVSGHSPWVMLPCIFDYACLPLTRDENQSKQLQSRTQPLRYGVKSARRPTIASSLSATSASVGSSLTASTWF